MACQKEEENNDFGFDCDLELTFAEKCFVAVTIAAGILCLPIVLICYPFFRERK